MIDFWLGTQFAIDVYVEGYATLPDWILVNQMKKQMTIIYENVTKLEVFNTTIHALSLSFNNFQSYSSSFLMSLQNEFPVISEKTQNNVFILNKMNIFKITLSDTELDDIQYNLAWKEGVFSFSSNFNKSVVTLSWNPTTDEIGNYTFELTYYDYLHRNQPKIYEFDIIVAKYSPPYFIEELSDISILYWNKSIFTFPDINFNNYDEYIPHYNISVSMEDDQPLENWIVFEENHITFDPGYNQLSITEVSLKIILSELISSISSSYTLNVMLVNNTSLNYFNSILDYSVSFPSALALNISTFTHTQFPSLNIFWSSTPIDSNIQKEFDYKSMIFVLKVTQNNQALLNWYIIGTDNWGRNFTSNDFKIKIIKRYPPSVTNLIPDQFMYVGQNSKLIYIPNDVFYDKNSGIELGAIEWYSTIGSKITVSSVSRK